MLLQYQINVKVTLKVLIDFIYFVLIILSLSFFGKWESQKIYNR